jgi:hypothetical protein
MIAPIYDWSGFYIGINGGGFSHNCWTNAGVGGVPTIPGVAEACHDASSGMVGGQTGYRWQSANWVFGLEGQGDWADSGVEVGFAPNWSVGVEYDHLFMARSTINLTTPTGAFSRTESVKQDVDIASVRANYRWGGPVIAKY